MIGKTLAHYEITSQLGKGGMGEVYQANDTKLGRNVAIKVLPEEFAKDADRIARFQREAKLLASLNHPNIAAIYGLEESDRTNFLVMELIEGQTLEGRIKSGPVPVEEALKIALQITEALEAAHEKGMVHRDLKPANIKVTPDGKVKVLDFGLAKAFVGGSENMNLSNSPTISQAATMQGVILGTAAYMSPEQAKGKSVDKRADIWAFGAVLFEMLTGKPAFPGDDISEILASVIKGDSNLALLPNNIHARVHELLTRCLQKDLRKRYADIADARYEIEQVLGDPGGVFVQHSTATKPERKQRLAIPLLISALVLVAVITGLAVWRLKPPEPKQVIRFDLELPAGQQFNFLGIAVSPDGRLVAYATQKGIHLRFLDRMNATLVSGTDGPAEQVFFSPDGKSIGYYADGKLKTIAIGGGVPRTICSPAGSMVGACWSKDDTILYGQAPGDIMQVPAIGGDPKSVVKAKSPNSVFPHMLPDGKTVLYTDSTGQGQGIVMVQALKSGKPKELFPGIARGYLPTGHILYNLPYEGNLCAIPFDLDTLEVKGDAIPKVEGVNGNLTAISESGTLVYVPRNAESTDRILLWVDKTGKEERIVAAEPNQYSLFRLSQDGSKAAFTVGNALRADIWIWDFDHENLIQLTHDDARNSDPLWTPDGRRIAFHSSPGRSEGGVYMKRADGTGEVEQLISVPDRLIYPLSWANGGKVLITEEQSGSKDSQMDIGMVLMDGNPQRQLLLHDKYNEFFPQVSPNGRWLAYVSDESEQTQVYVRSFPDVDREKHQISTKGGSSPRWSSDHKQLFYRNKDEVWAVKIDADTTFKWEKPEVLFRGEYFSLPSRMEYDAWDVSHDDKRFLMLKRQEAVDGSSMDEARPKIDIVVNWFEELKGMVPVK